MCPTLYNAGHLRAPRWALTLKWFAFVNLSSNKSPKILRDSLLGKPLKYHSQYKLREDVSSDGSKVITVEKREPMQLSTILNKIVELSPLIMIYAVL